MAESTPAKSDAGTPGPKYPAPKDKVCQYCGVAFTSSSLGRHLDQFIKDKKPKRPDDVHDVDEIRRLRGGITRRQPRNSLRAGRETLTPVSTPKLRDSSATHEGLRAKSPFSPKEKNDSVNGWGLNGAVTDAPNGDSVPNGRRPAIQRAASRQIQKAQYDSRNKAVDAADRARAAELALTELLGSLRAAK